MTERDRNLLFGVFAVQLKKVSSSQIMAAAGAWATDPSKDLPDRLVDEAIDEHGGDTAATLTPRFSHCSPCKFY